MVAGVETCCLSRAAASSGSPMCPPPSTRSLSFTRMLRSITERRVFRQLSRIERRTLVSVLSSSDDLLRLRRN